MKPTLTDTKPGLIHCAWLRQNIDRRNCVAVFCDMFDEHQESKRFCICQQCDSWKDYKNAREQS